MITVTCPCCGGSLGELPEPDKVRQCLSPTEQKVFDLLMEAGPNGMIKLDLSIALHGEQVGVSESGIKYTAALVTKVRSKLDKYGYFIDRNRPPQRGIYRIIPAEVVQ
ncbi:hypothetical protein G6L13_05515 [Agrobacterium tumefaciens]|uniref:hypothetical protein n=1 Tax=Agrobacterium tumefaciens TaxID=358 RepID=UPI001572EF2E|nr:hypothetical protein [Agrobacterium tumefaciens]NTA79942.1 hypothetical protein [Agrobacterium tumefaciens]